MLEKLENVILQWQRLSAHLIGPTWDISTTIWKIKMKITDIHGPQRTNFTDFGDHLKCNLAQ